jgi:hypothetical protein
MRLRRKRRRLLRGLVLPVVLGIVVSLFTTPAFTSANTVPATKRGEGAATISGYAITDVHYNLNAVNPENIDSVTFSLDGVPPDGSSIRMRLGSTEITWYTCGVSGSPTGATCTTTSPQATLAHSDELRVVVAD